MKNDDTLPAELHNTTDDAMPAPLLSDALAACIARWPDMARYADTARVEPLWDARAECWRSVVTVTCFEKRTEERTER